MNAGRRLSALARTRYLELSARKRALAKERKELAKRTEPDGQRSSRRRTEEIGREIERIEEQLPECTVWSRACAPAFEMILAGAALIVGSDGNVAAVDTGDGREIWRAACGGAARGLAAARGRLYVSTDLGHILCFGAAR